MSNLMGFDNQEQLNSVMKAAELITTNTIDYDSRSVFSPQNLEAEIKLVVPTDTPIRNRLARSKGFGEASAWDRMTSKLHITSGGRRGLGTNTSISFADAGAPNETTQTYVTKAAAYKLLGRKVELGGLAIAASRGKTVDDVFTQRQRVKMMELMLGEEELIIHGNSSSNTLEFDGLNVQITTNSGSASLLSASGVNVYTESLYFEGASPTMLVANPRQVRALADELQGTGSIQRIAIDSQGNGIGGVRLAKILNSQDGSLIDVFTSRYVNDQAFLLTDRMPSGEIGIDMQDLIPVSRVDVPSSNYSSIAFVIEASVLRVMHEPYQYKIQDLATS